jgi:hypothetical protein
MTDENKGRVPPPTMARVGSCKRCKGEDIELWPVEGEEQWMCGKCEEQLLQARSTD